MSTPQSTAIFIDAQPCEVAAVFHGPPPRARRDVSVLLLAPWGWDDVASARSRRALADALATAGLPTLRIDLPGTGDSDGSPRDDGLVEDWLRAVSRSAAWLQALDGTRTVAIVGLGLGGLLARAAIAAGAPADELVLWGVPPNGREFLRRTRAFARLAGLPPDECLEDGAIAAGGFLLSAETAAAIEQLDPTTAARGHLQRALVLDAPSSRGSAADGLEARGVRVQSAPTDGWAELTSHPEHSVIDPEAVARIREWLLAGAGREVAEVAVAARRSVTLACGTRETAFDAPAPTGRLTGVLTRPGADVPVAGPCVVFLSAGAVRRSGPNRMWVEAARRLAACGTTAARVDLASIGESDARRPERPWTTAEFYETDGDAQVATVLDRLEALGAGTQFVLVGLCSGGYWAFRAATDPRVARVVLLNPGALIWDRQATGRAELRRLSRLRDPEWWGKLARGEVDLRVGRFRRAGAALLHGGAAAPAGHAASLERAFDAIAATGTHVCLAFCSGEIVLDELDRDGLAERLAERPEVTLERLPCSDHTMRPLASQAGLHALLDREVLALSAAW